MTARIAAAVQLVSIALGLGACRPAHGLGPTRPPGTPTVPSPSVVSTRTAGEPTPALVYLRGNELMEVSGDGSLRSLARIPDAGPVRFALLIRDTVLLLREFGLQDVRLSDGTSQLLPFEAPVLFGYLLVVDADTALYSAVLDDGGGGTMGFTAHAGYYSVEEGILHPLMEQEGSLAPLGVDAEGDDACFLPLGGDPEFREVWLVSLTTGAVSARLAIDGQEFAALNPDSSQIATSASRFLPDRQRLEFGLRLYDLRGEGVGQGLWLSLPRPESHAFGLIWSGDGRCLYFHLRPGSPSDDPTVSYGLWCLDPEAMSFMQVSALADPTEHLVMISPDDRWLVLRPEREYELTLVDLRTGSVVIPGMPGAFDDVVHWR